MTTVQMLAMLAPYAVGADLMAVYLLQTALSIVAFGLAGWAARPYLKSDRRENPHA